ncbi:hypothetical protein CCACVL1_11982 [Corchorus capsularis]|uniref:Uncharacterized protein n=1 Tax=Corchorus capsularis TaxID=210143 RepID=A0A1R3IID3_COCAP|nr:hypothetical protein CCACVL1_11982 [Corchorus capsularis]
MHRSNPFSFSSVELLETPDLEEDILDAWMEEHFIAISDNEDIHEDQFEHFLDITDDGDIPEAKVVEHFAFGANREIIPLSEASFVNQVVLVPTQQQPYEHSSTQKVKQKYY